MRLSTLLLASSWLLCLACSDSGASPPRGSGEEGGETARAAGQVTARGSEASDPPAPPSEPETRPQTAETRPATQPTAPAAPPATDDWAEVLRRFVTDDGGFRYAALAGDAGARERLERYVAAIGEANSEGWSRDEALAFYINAYNALTVHAVLEHWPIESVMDIEGFFDGQPHRVAGRERTLNQLENDILRSDVYAEPRIHFAVNCASASCPPLQGEPFAAETLDATLARAARSFVRATTHRQGRVVRLSKLFEWFAADFERVGGVRAFVASQLPEADADAVRDPATRLRYDEYDWSINARP